MSETQAAPKAGTQISCSRDFANWLKQNNVSFGLTSYQSGRLYLVGHQANGVLSFHERHFVRAMGVAASPQRIFLANHFQIWRLENVLAPGQMEGVFDRNYVPRNAQTTGDLDIHDVGVEKSGRVIFVNTKYSCLATPSATHSFKPIWKPPFISAAGAGRSLSSQRVGDAGRRGAIRNRSLPQRRGNGLARPPRRGRPDHRRQDQRVRDAKAFDAAFAAAPQRKALGARSRGAGGSARSTRKPARRKRLPSCRVFCVVSRSTDILPLSGCRCRATAVLSGLELDGELENRDADPWCGVQVIDTRSGDVVQWIRFTGEIRELFDVFTLPGVKNPMATGLRPDHPVAHHHRRLGRSGQARFRVNAQRDLTKFHIFPQRRIRRNPLRLRLRSPFRVIGGVYRISLCRSH